MSYNFNGIVQSGRSLSCCAVCVQCLSGVRFGGCAAAPGNSSVTGKNFGKLFSKSLGQSVRSARFMVSLLAVLSLNPTPLQTPPNHPAVHDLQYATIRPAVPVCIPSSRPCVRPPGPRPCEPRPRVRPGRLRASVLVKSGAWFRVFFGVALGVSLASPSPNTYRPASAASSPASSTASAGSSRTYHLLRERRQRARPGNHRTLLLSKFVSLLAGCPHAFYLQRRDTHPNHLAIVHSYLRATARPRRPPPPPLT